MLSFLVFQPLRAVLMQASFCCREWVCWLAPTPYIFAWSPGRNAGLLLLFVQEISKIQHLIDNMEYSYKYLVPYTYARVCLHVIVHVRVRISTYGIQYIYIQTRS